ncbi:MAG: hypothetical protein V8T01_01090 [Oscillospiraceae bacterium]
MLAKKDEDLDVTVVCSTNERLRKELMERYIGRKDVHVLGHVEDMSLLMDTADVYLTKPGGISTTKAAVKGLPLVLMNTVGGCESYNLQFFQRAGAALERQERGAVGGRGGLPRAERGTARAAEGRADRDRIREPGRADRAGDDVPAEKPGLAKRRKSGIITSAAQAGTGLGGGHIMG